MMSGWGNSWKTSWKYSWGGYIVEQVTRFVKMPRKFLAFPRFKLGK